MMFFTFFRGSAAVEEELADLFRDSFGVVKRELPDVGVDSGVLLLLSTAGVLQREDGDFSLLHLLFRSQNLKSVFVVFYGLAAIVSPLHISLPLACHLIFPREFVDYEGHVHGTTPSLNVSQSIHS